ncbi:hypothetical protein P43SY_008888 [Pythium insidiosum]|uniref:Uncharacterized protein n=1 Tax=Pythium insidiosum TaxID=114742 RepID=A0AAD5LX94_PYTIN|nr:hypothetical protein P43SY_008888 [Pythium insidiosum]
MVVPIAKRLKQSAESVLRVASAPSAEDEIAARIKQLEAELQGGSSSDEDDEGSDSDSDSDSDSSSASDDDANSANDSGAHAGVKATKKGGVISMSAFADERVEGLPEHLLPKASATSASMAEQKKKRKRDGDDNRQGQNPALPSLLNEVQWAKRVPFACKPCGFVGKNVDEFHAHRASPEHLAKQQAVQSQVLVCKLCDKSFTSPHQLEEHKAGKWHQQRAQQRKARHVVKICYDFMRGSCRRGDTCAFEHTETKAMKSGKALEKTRKRICEIYERTGKCKFGDRCLFSHDSSAN